MEKLAENIKRIRTSRGLTQRQIEAAGGPKQGQVSQYETGEDVPELSSLLKLATILEVPLESLVEGVDVKFDVMYQGLQVTVSDEATPPREDASPAETPPLDPSMDHIVRGFPASEASDEPSASPASPEEMAEARASLHRAAADILSAARFLAPRPAPVARDLGPGLRARDARRRSRTRPAAAKNIAPKRR